MATTQEIPSKAVAEVRNGAISFDALLDTTEVVSTIASIAATPTGLTFSNQKVNDAVVDIKGSSVAIGRAVQFRVSGGSAGVLYTGVATVTTNATPAQTLTATFRLLVE